MSKDVNVTLTSSPVAETREITVPSTVELVDIGCVTVSNEDLLGCIVVLEVLSHSRVVVDDVFDTDLLQSVGVSDTRAL